MGEVLVNPWKPVPVYSIQNEKINKPKVNEDVGPLALRVTFECSDNALAKDVTVNFSLKLTDEDVFSEIINLKTKQVVKNYTCKKAVALKIIDKRDFELVLAQSGNIIAEKKLKFRGLDSSSE